MATLTIRSLDDAVRDRPLHGRRGAPESSESPAPVVGLSHGHQPFRPLCDQSSLRRLEVPQSISGS